MIPISISALSASSQIQQAQFLEPAGFVFWNYLLLDWACELDDSVFNFETIHYAASNVTVLIETDCCSGE
jgi:hypothetical protein